MERIYLAIQISLPERPGSGRYPAPWEVASRYVAGKFFYALAAMMISYIFIVPQRGLLRNANKNTTIKQDNAEGDSPPRAGGGGRPWQTWARPPWRTVGRHLRWQNDDDDDEDDANVDRRTKRIAPGSRD